MTTKNRKLTEEQKQEIVAMRSEDATLRKIASKFGVSPKTIMFVLNPDYYTAHKEKNREYFRSLAAAKKLNKVSAGESGESGGAAGSVIEEDETKLFANQVVGAILDSIEPQ